METEQTRIGPDKKERSANRNGPATRNCTARLLAALCCSVVLVQPSVSRAASIAVVNGAVAINPDGDCSLVEAIENANSGAQSHSDCASGSSGEDTVVLAAGGTYSFDAATAQIPITTTVTIDGSYATLTHSAGGFFYIESDGFLRVLRMTLRESEGIGVVGAITGKGSLFVADSILEENTTSIDGSAVRLIWSTSNKIAEFRNTIFRDNVAARSGGAIDILAFAETDLPPPINLSVVLQGVTLRGNGRSINVPGVETGTGGALALGVASTIAEPMMVRINDSLFQSNFAGRAGAIFLGGFIDAAIDRTTFDGNNALTEGGALLSGVEALSLTRSLVSNNSIADPSSAATGGGLKNVEGSVTVINSTFSGNIADRGGAIANYVSNFANSKQAVIILDHVTVTNNEARDSASGGGIYNEQTGAVPARINLQNTLILGNTGAGGNTDCRNDGGILDSFGYNVKSASALAGCSYTGTGTGDDISVVSAVSTNVNLTLADNGGPTLTHSIPVGSEARNIIPANANGCDVDQVDQRGRLRNSGNGTASCDAGAYEYGALTVKCDADLVVDYQALSGAPTPFEATSSVTLGPSLSIDGTDIEVNAPTVSFISSTTIDGLFKAGNVTNCP